MTHAVRLKCERCNEPELLDLCVYVGERWVCAACLPVSADRGSFCTDEVAEVLSHGGYSWPGAGTWNWLEEREAD